MAAKEVTEKRVSDRLAWERFVVKTWHHYEKSASNRRLTFDLTIHKLSKELKKKTCPFLGIKLLSRFGYIAVDGEPTPDNLATLDRIDSSLGYTDENTIICSMRANSVKGNGTLEEFKKIVKVMEKL